MIKVLVVDDSAFMRQIYKKTINKDPELKVIETARNGSKALELIPKLKPDVITLDVEMPVKNGIETLKEIMELSEPIPVVMISALNSKETVLKALEMGAFDFIPKPSGTISLNIDQIKEQLIQKLKAATKSKKISRDIEKIKTYPGKITRKKSKKFPVVAIGSSSGGPKALKKLLSVFPDQFPAAMIIVQHMPAGFTTSLARRLNQTSKIIVKEAEEDDYIQPGVALVTPGDYHLTVNQKEQIILDNEKPPQWGVRPCVDYMMTSVAKIYQERVIGVILTGMGHDGALGMKEIKKYNGYGIVEDKSTALVYGMPGATIKEEAYDKITPLDQIGFKIIDLIEGRN